MEACEASLEFSDDAGGVAGKISEFLEIADEFSAEFPIKEEMVEKVMQELQREITCSSRAGAVNAPVPPASLGSELPPSPFDFGPQSNKEKSCGVLFSGTAAATTAGIDVGAPLLVGLPEKFGGGKEEVAGAGEEEIDEEKMDGGDCGEMDDEWLARVIGWGPVQLDEWT